MTAASFTLFSAGALTVTFQFLKGSAFRQCYSLFFFRKTKYYSRNFHYSLDRNNQILKDYFVEEDNSNRTLFVDGSQGIGKTSYLKILADQFSKKCPVLYMSVRGTEPGGHLTLINIATDIKYFPPIHLCKYIFSLTFLNLHLI